MSASPWRVTPEGVLLDDDHGPVATLAEDHPPTSSIANLLAATPLLLSYFLSDVDAVKHRGTCPTCQAGNGDNCLPYQAFHRESCRLFDAILRQLGMLRTAPRSPGRDPVA